MNKGSNQSRPNSAYFKCLNCRQGCEKIVMQDRSVFCSIECAEMFRAKRNIKVGNRGHVLGPSDL